MAAHHRRLVRRRCSSSSSIANVEVDAAALARPIASSRASTSSSSSTRRSCAVVRARRRRRRRRRRRAGRSRHVVASGSPCRRRCTPSRGGSTTRSSVTTTRSTSSSSPSGTLSTRWSPGRWSPRSSSPSSAHVALGGLFVQRRPSGRRVPTTTTANPLDAVPAPPGGDGRRRWSCVPAARPSPTSRCSSGSLFVVGAVGSLFRAWELLYSSAGVVAGAGYTDVHARLPGTRVTLVVALALAVMLFVNVWRRRWRWPLYAVAGWIVVMILVRGRVARRSSSRLWSTRPSRRRSSSTSPTTSRRRAPPTTSTRSRRQQYPLEGDLTPAKLQANEATVRNIRLWDPIDAADELPAAPGAAPVLQLFTDVDVDRYTRQRRLPRDDALGARAQHRRPRRDNAQTWVNEHITYTHGFGAVVSAVNQVTPDGSPDFLVKDVPPVSKGNLHHRRAAHLLRRAGHRLHSGQDVRARVRLPGRRSGDVFGEYDGDGGIPIGSTWRRLAFAFRFGTIKFLTTSYIDGRQPHHHPQQHPRAARGGGAVPELRRRPLHGDRRRTALLGRRRLHDDRPLPVQPAARATSTTSATRSRRSSTPTTARSSFYTFDESDPMLATYAKVFPDMFKPAERSAADAAGAHQVSRGLLRPAGRDVRDLPRHRARRALQQGQPVADPRQRRARGQRPDERLLRDHASARRPTKRSSCSCCPSCPTARAT